jgi:type IV secretion system protein VirB6
MRLELPHLFVRFLTSSQTNSSFWKWLWYGIGTLFSLGVFVAMTSIVLDVMVSVAASFWVTAGAGALMGQNLTDGMTTVSMQQGGIGLLMTFLLISAPPIAASFFQGAIGSAMHFSAFGQGGAGRTGANPGESGYRPQPPANPSTTSDGGNVATPRSPGTPTTTTPPEGTRGVASPSNPTNNPP